MNNKDFGKKLEVRTKKFAVDIIKLSIQIPNTSEGRVIKNQITKSGTSVGANYREANRSRSRADFRNKIKICESESSETVYWLEILEALKWEQTEKMVIMMKEANELLAIFTAIAKNSR